MPNGNFHNRQSLEGKSMPARSLSLRIVLPAVLSSIVFGLSANAQEVAFFSNSDAEAALVGKVLLFKRPSDGKELRWELKQGGYLFANNRGSGKQDSGSWEVKDDGGLCTKFKGNSVESCYYFYRDQGVLRRTAGKTPSDVAKSIQIAVE
jgi:hypothetical protein